MQFLLEDFNNDDLVGIEVFEVIQSISNQPRRDWEVKNDDAKIILKQESDANMVNITLFAVLACHYHVLDGFDQLISLLHSLSK